MAASGPLSAVRAIVIRLDPTRLRFDVATGEGGRRWSIAQMPPAAVVALNAGQFRGPWPWGWLVEDGVEEQEPGRGTLTMAFTVDSAGRTSLLTPDEIPAARGHVRLALQSYPALLVGEGQRPWEIQEAGRGVDLDHRDSRLGLGTLADGSVVIVITRLTSLGRAGETLPFGPTVPEMAAFMQSLGCRRAMLLDGGLSSQLALRQANGALRRWSNWREVPLGIVVTPMAPQVTAAARRER